MQQPKPEILVCSLFLPQPVYIATPFNPSDGDIGAVHQYSLRLIEFLIFRGTSIIKFFHGV
jgi:hypothetical protein